MVAVNSTKINTLHPAKKTGVVMHEKVYSLVSAYILQAVFEERELTFTNLLERAEVNFCDPLEGRPEIGSLYLKNYSIWLISLAYENDP
jgi:hypothetical protein